MKRHLIFILLTVNSMLFAQLPSINVESEKDKKTDLSIKSMSIDVVIVGNIATTTYDIIFFNPSSQILEGELSMPLADGQELCRYALDINGILREGVVIEKIKARQTFEAVVRQGIDPGIASITKGNFFKTRIYPIPANGVKRVVIAVSQTLKTEEDKIYYSLPMSAEQTIGKFNLELRVIKNKANQKLNVTYNKGNNIIELDKDDGYYLSFERTNFSSPDPLQFIIPADTSEQAQVYTCEFEGQSYFYINTKTPKLNVSKKVAAKTVAVYWDNSFSADQRNIELELAFLSNYLSSLNNPTLKLINFNYISSNEQTFTNKEDLIAAIRKLKNDGATAIEKLNFKTDCDEILLFTDGINTIGTEELTLPKTPIYTTNSTTGSNYSLLKNIAHKTNGEFIDLNAGSLDNAVLKMGENVSKFLYTDFNAKEIKDVYPNSSVSIGERFELAGILTAESANINIYYGDKNGPSSSQSIQIKKTTDAPISRIYASKKIEALNTNYEKNKEEIQALGQKFNIVTKNTSFIVLDRVEDYLTYNINPPKELQAEYEKLKASKSKENVATPESIFKSNTDYLSALTAWYNHTINLNNTATKQTVPISNNNCNNPNIFQDGDRTITGVVVDDTDEVLPGVMVKEHQGTNRGTLTDDYGRFTLFVSQNTDSLAVESIAGYGTFKITGNDLRLVLIADSIDLSSIEVMGNYGATISRNDLIATVSTSDYLSEEDSDVILEVSERRYTFSTSGSVSTDSVSTDGWAYNEPSAGAFETLGMGNESLSNIKKLAWIPDAPYVSILKKSTLEQLDSVYFELKKENAKTPSFYLIVANTYFERKQNEKASRIISNVVELDLENAELLKTAARKLMDEGEYDMAIKLYIEVKNLRPEEPQSYRDLALAYQANKQYQEALDLFCYILDKQWPRFDELKSILFNELNNLISLHEAELNLKNVKTEYIKPMPIDIRITIDWTSNDNDIDLWVVDPQGEKCMYNHNKTAIGGKISKDFTDGYGPEEFSLKTAVRGYYTVYVNYYGDRRQTKLTPVTVYATLYTHYGTANQKEERIALQLDQKKETIQIGQLEFKE